MPIEILMPALSPTMSEGNLAKWLKNEGDTVEAGDVIAEIETDKATMEVEAVDEGVIGKILVAGGTANVAVNTPIAILLEDGESADAIKSISNSNDKKAAPAESEKSATETKKEEASKPLPVAETADGNRIKASPLAKRLAQQNNLDLSVITGTGPNGRIVKDDITTALATGQGKASSVSATPPSAAPVASGPGAKTLVDGLGMQYREEPVSGMRKTIASRLSESKATVPHFYLTVDCMIDELLALRASINEAATDGEYKVSVNDMIIKASALALKKVPEANAMWNTSSVLYFDDADISVAVATPSGLITPIVKQAQNKSLVAISDEMKDLANRAKQGKLKPEEYQGGTFTISNLGMFGIKHFEAIINPPQSCILAVGAGEKVPAVVGNDIKVVTKMHLTLSVDHRVVDGAVAAQFLQKLKVFIENPGAMLAQ